ncbi:hypothetical protein CYMTET_50896 [Cymbomonas tetramitiformis]|uniref:Protein kinase domain-containing protein n=1 Tax=Cymbomonas tetramitiformis TaxID=36881 RepID=A0AAE0BM55_9CHLO|nr:hypothetical protein CYMTET_50896 [Cymbomonas tetramitiformis]
MSLSADTMSLSADTVPLWKKPERATHNLIKIIHLKYLRHLQRMQGGDGHHLLLWPSPAEVSNLCPHPWIAQLAGQRYPIGTHRSRKAAAVPCCSRRLHLQKFFKRSIEHGPNKMTDPCHGDAQGTGEDMRARWKKGRSAGGGDGCADYCYTLYLASVGEWGGGEVGRGDGLMMGRRVTGAVAQAGGGQRGWQQAGDCIKKGVGRGRVWVGRGGADAGNIFGAAGAAALAEAVKHADCKLHTLNLTGNGVGAAGAEALAEAVKHADCKLHTLNLARDNIGDAGAAALAEAVKHADCKLHTLNLSRNGMGNAGATALAEAVKHADCKLHTLDLSCASLVQLGAVCGSWQRDCKPHTLNLSCARIGAAGATALAEAVKHADCKLHTLDLRVNGIKDAGATALAEAVKHADCKLHTLDLSGNGIKDAVATALAEATMTSEMRAAALAEAVEARGSKLQHADLSVNGIKDAGATALAEAVKHADCKLHTLDLSVNGIKDAGATALAEAVKHADCKLRTLDLRDNGITQEGAKGLAKARLFSICDLRFDDVRGVTIHKNVLQQAVEVLKARLRHMDAQLAAHVEPAAPRVRMTPGISYSAMMEVLTSWMEEEKQVSARVKHESQQVMDLLRHSPNSKERHISAAAARNKWRVYHENVVRKVEAVLHAILQTVEGMQGMLAACDSVACDGIGPPAGLPNADPLIGVRRMQEAHGGITGHAPSSATLTECVASIKTLQGNYAQKASDLAHIAHVGQQVAGKSGEIQSLQGDLRQLRGKVRQQTRNLEDALDSKIDINNDESGYIDRIAGMQDEGNMRQELDLAFELYEVPASERQQQVECLMPDFVRLKQLRQEQVAGRRQRDRLQKQVLEVCLPHFPEEEVALRPTGKEKWELEIHRTGLLLQQRTLDDYEDCFQSGRKLVEFKIGRRNVYLKRVKGGNDEDLVVLKEIPRAERQAVRREVLLQATVKHPAILEMNGVFLDKNKVYIELPYCRGGHLLEWCREYEIEHNEKVSWEQLRVMLYSALQGLGHLHGLGYVHRDIKPENILVTVDRRAKLCDFGLCATANRDVHSTTDLPAGPYTEGYKAPEILRGDRGSAASDMWAMGASIETLVGVIQNDGIPRELLPLVQRMKSTDVAARPSAAQALAHPVFAAVVQAPAARECDQTAHSSKEKVDQLHIVLAEDSSEEHDERVDVLVSRHSIVIDMLREFREIDPADLRKRLRLQLEDEPRAQDEGGVQDDAFSAFFDQVCAEEADLFESGGGEHDRYLPKGSSRHDLESFEALGKILLKALIKKLPIRTRFASYLFAHLLGRAPSEAYYQDFSADGAAELARTRICANVEEIIPSYTDAGGNEVDVRASNQRLAVVHMLPEQLVTPRKAQLDAIKRGFHCIDINELAKKKVGCEIMRKLSTAELMLAMCASASLTADDILAVTYFPREHGDRGCWMNSSNTPHFFEEVLRGLDQTSLHHLLLRVTGSAALPYNAQQTHIKILCNRNHGGFNMHTCFNEMEMCEFESADELRTALTTAILEDQAGSFNQA